MFTQENFYTPIKIKNTDVFFWSDLHLGHDKDFVYGKRNFSSVQDHDAEIISRWNWNVLETSKVFLLGDVMFGQGGGERLKSFLQSVNFNELYLLPGNHHAGWKQLFASSTNFKLKISENKTVYFVPNYLEIFVTNQPIVLCHYPIVSWNGQGKGSWCLHGHSHGSLHNGKFGDVLYSSKTLDLGLECFPAPVSFNFLKGFFDVKKTVSFDHHDKNTNNPF